MSSAERKWHIMSMRRKGICEPSSYLHGDSDSKTAVHHCLCTRSYSPAEEHLTHLPLLGGGTGGGLLLPGSLSGSLPPSPHPTPPPPLSHTEGTYSELRSRLPTTHICALQPGVHTAEPSQAGPGRARCWQDLRRTPLRPSWTQSPVPSHFIPVLEMVGGGGRTKSGKGGPGPGGVQTPQTRACQVRESLASESPPAL